MFKLAPKNAPFAHDVIIPEITDTGSIIRHKVRFLFNRLTRTELDERETAINEAYPLGEDERVPARRTLDLQVERALLYCADWKDVIGPDGAPLEFNRDNLFDLFNAYPSAYQAIFDTYVRLVFNSGEALLRKNS